MRKRRITASFLPKLTLFFGILVLTIENLKSILDYVCECLGVCIFFKL